MGYEQWAGGPRLKAQGSKQINMTEFERILSKYDYADLRIERSMDENVKIIDDETKIYSGSSFGISVRVLIGNAWGFASSNSNDENVIKNLVEKAERLANMEKSNIKIKKGRAEKKRIETDFTYLPLEEKAKMLKDAVKRMEGNKIIGKNVSYSENTVESEFYSSEGSEIFQKINHAYLNCTAIAKEGEMIQRGYETVSSIHGFEKIDSYKIADIARDKAQRYLRAELPPKGRFVVIMDPEMTGVFSHEALGHASEGDSIIDRESILHDKLNKKIGNELVDIADDPSADDFGFFVYDEEGIKGTRTELVKGGVLKGYLNSRETAFKLNIDLNGHCRAMNYGSFPIVRMSNTYFQPKNACMEDIFDVKYAIYVKGMKGGSVDPFSGGFMFKAEEAYEVKNGEKGRLLRDIGLSGNVIQTMNNVELVGKDFATSPGFCGKFGQSVPVSDGGPHIRVTDVMVG